MPHQRVGYRVPNARQEQSPAHQSWIDLQRVDIEQQQKAVDQTDDEPVRNIATGAQFAQDSTWRETHATTPPAHLLTDRTQAAANAREPGRDVNVPESEV